MFERFFKPKKLPPGAVDTLLSKDTVTHWREEKWHIRSVSVSNPETTTSNYTKDYITYAITIDADSTRADGKYESLEENKSTPPKTCSVRRRFSDFIWLRRCLAKCFPGLFIPPLPPKKFFGNLKHNFVEDRCGDLQIFLERLISRHQFMTQSRAFKIFVTKHAEAFSKEKKEVDTIAQYMSVGERLALYRRLFPDLQDRPETIPKDPEDMVHFMKSFLLDSLAQAEKAVKSSAGITHCLACVSTLQDKMWSALEEKEVPEGCGASHGRADFRKKIKKIAEETKLQRQRWYTLMAKSSARERDDIKAMLEVVNYWQTLNKRLVAINKATYKEDDAWKIIEVGDFHGVVTRLLFTSEMAFHWRERTTRFSDDQTNLAKSQRKHAATTREVLENQNPVEECADDKHE